MSLPDPALRALAEMVQWPVVPPDEALRAWWRATAATAVHSVAVALSGGADSTALLLAAARLHLCAEKNIAAPQRIVALHVHHGLQAAADDFARQARQLCAALQQSVPNLSFQQRQIAVPHAKGDSLEASARQARYATLAEMAQAAQTDVVLLGHHADDQAESVLLALSRGAGVAGLAGMAVSFERHGMRFARPLLDLPGAALRAWLQHHGVPWAEDPSNADLRFTRNKFRHLLMPAVAQAMPAFRTSLARTARLAAEADALLADLAAEDLAQIGTPPDIQRLRQLARPRQANALRHWLKTSHSVIGSEAQLQALLDVLAACRTRGHRIHIRVSAGHVQRDGQYLTWSLLQ